MGRYSGRLVATLVRSRMLNAALLFALASQIAWAQAPQEIETTMKKMLDAAQSGSLADFVAAGDASFQSGMSQALLDGVSAQFAPRLKQGYTSTFFGTLN